MGLMYYRPLDGSDPLPIAVGAQGPEGPEGPEGPQGPPGDATKEYVDQQDALKVSKSGDTMTGPLVVPAPTATGHAATKGYVDAIYKGGTDGTGDPNPAGLPLKVFTGYAGISDGGSGSADWSAAGFTKPPTLVVNVIGYVDPNEAYTVSSSGLTTTGTNFYVRKISGGVVTSPGGAAVNWVAIGI